MGKHITKVKKFLRKLIILGDPSVNRDFFLDTKLISKQFTISTKNTIGTDIYSANWYLANELIEYKFTISDINTAPEFDKTLNGNMMGGAGCIIIYDYTLPDIIQHLEKWILETIIICGNIPILLLGNNYQENNLEETIADVQEFVSDKKESWNLSIQNVNVSNNSSIDLEVMDNLYLEIYERNKNHELIALRDGTLEKLKELIINETETLTIHRILESIYRTSVVSVKKLVQSLSIDFFKDFILNQEHLEGISKILLILHWIDAPLSKKLLKRLIFENLIKKIEQEKKLLEIILLFREFKTIDSRLWKKFLKTIITSDLLTRIITQAWVEVIITARGTHFTIMELVKSVDGSDSLSVEIIRYVSEADLKRKINETLNQIGTILAIIFPFGVDQAIELIENVPNRIRELAREIITEEKDGEKKTIEEEPLKASLEIGEFSRKEAAEKEISHTLSELDIIVSCLRQFSNNKDKMNLINKISLDNICLKIKGEKKLTTIIKLLQQLDKIDTTMTETLLKKIPDLLVEKIALEPSIIIIHDLLEFVEAVDPREMMEIISNYNIESLANKMIFFYAELDLEQLDIPLLTGLATNYGREMQYTLIEMLHHLFPEIPRLKLTTLLQLIFDLIEIVKIDSNNKSAVTTAHLLEIYNFFIESKFDEISKLLKLITQSLPISITEIKEVFISQLMTEAIENFSYEKKRLFDFVQSLPKQN